MDCLPRLSLVRCETLYIVWIVLRASMHSPLSPQVVHINCPLLAHWLNPPRLSLRLPHPYCLFNSNPAFKFGLDCFGCGTPPTGCVTQEVKHNFLSTVKTKVIVCTL